MSTPPAQMADALEAFTAKIVGGQYHSVQDVETGEWHPDRHLLIYLRNAIASLRACGDSSDPASVLGQAMVDRIVSWLKFRTQLYDQEASGKYPAAKQWHWSDDEAAYIVHSIATMFEITIEGER